jgi:hypothetical protein
MEPADVPGADSPQGKEVSPPEPTQAPAAPAGANDPKTSAEKRQRQGGSDTGNKILPSADSVKAVGGLIAVVVGVLSITALAITTMAFIDSGRDANSIVPLASSAFGVVSAVVGAYLGIKIGTDQSASFAEETNRAHAQIGALQNFVPEDQRAVANQAAATAAAASTTPGQSGA